MVDQYRNAFGRLVVEPGRMTLRERVTCLRRLAGSLQASHEADARWLGQTLTDWMTRGGDLEQRLGVKPPRGSHARPEALVRQAETARLLLRLAAVVGSDARASRVLGGVEPAPAAAVDLVDVLRERRAPTSRRAFVRARTATRQGR